MRQSPLRYVIALLSLAAAPAWADGQVCFGSSDVRVSENSPTVTLSLVRSGSASGAIGANLATRTGGSNPGQPARDYVDTSGSVTWADADLEAKPFEISLIDNQVPDGDRTFQVAITSTTNATACANNVATVTIVDDDSQTRGAASFVSSTIIVGENAGNATITIRRSGGSLGAGSVLFSTRAATSGEPATAGQDYTATSTRVSWADGDRADKTVLVPIRDDGAVEPSELFTIELSDPIGVGVVSPSSGSVTISDNDQVGNTTVAFVGAPYQFSERVGATQFSVERTGNAGGEVRVRFRTVAGSATAGADYETRNGELGWADGELGVKTGFVNIVDDTTPEDTENFVVVLETDQTGVTIQNASAQFNINDDEQVRPGVIRLLSTQASVSETGQSIVLSVGRFNGSEGVVSVRFSTESGTATADRDYASTSGTLTWADGDTDPQDVTIPLFDNRNPDGNRTFALRLSSPDRASLDPNASVANITIIDDEGSNPGTINLTAASTSVREDAPTVTIGIVRSGGSFGAVSVSYATQPGTAAEGFDYEPVSGTVSFANGESGVKNVTVPIKNDTSTESGETFTFTITQPNGGASLGTPTANQVTIIDDEQPSPGTVQFLGDRQNVNENVGKVAVSVTREGGFAGSIRVSYQTADGSAMSGSDFVAKAGVLNWASGDGDPKIIEIDVTDDQADENSESFSITLSNPSCVSGCSSTPVALGTPATYALTILDNENNVAAAGALSFSRSQASIAEGTTNDRTTLFVRRVGGSDGAITADYEIKEGTAKFGQQIPTANSSGTLTWAAGNADPKPIPLSALVDANSSNEQFSVELSNLTGGAVRGETPVAQVVIVDTTQTNNPPGSPGVIGLVGGSAGASVSEAGTIYEAEVARSGGSTGEVRVECRFEPGTASATTDFGLSSQVLAWADKELGSKFCNTNIVNNDRKDGNRTFSVRLVNPMAANTDGSPSGGTPPTLAPNASSRTVTIIDDEALCNAGVVRVSTTERSVRADVGAIQFTVQRTGGVCGAITATYEVQPGSAVPTVDYAIETPTGTLTWADGEAGQRLITVRILPVTQLANDKKFAIQLSGEQVAGNANRETITITNTIGRSSGGGSMSWAWLGLALLLSARKLRVWGQA